VPRNRAASLPRTVVHVLPYMAEGGTEKHVLTLLRRFQDRYDCVLLAPRGTITPEFLKLGIRYVEFPEIRGWFPHKIRVFRDRLEEIDRQRRIDLIHVHAAHEFVAFARKQLPETPIIFHLSAHQGSRLSRAFNYRLSARISRKRADLLIAVSEQEKRIVVGKGFPEDRVRIVYNGYELAEGDDSERIERMKRKLGLRGSLVVGNLGRLHKTKRLDLLVRAFAELQLQEENARLLFIGDGPEKKSLEKLACRMKLRSEPLFPGFVNRGDRVLRIFDIFVLPTSYEGCSNVLVEAMAKGLPIVATDIPSVRWMFEDGVSALLFREGDAGDLAEKLRVLSRDPGLRERIGRGAFTAFEKNFDARIMAEKVDLIYRSLFTGENR
jgi:glycosyltransferase involved in cell wall biosynthesis